MLQSNWRVASACQTEFALPLWNELLRRRSYRLILGTKSSFNISGAILFLTLNFSVARAWYISMMDRNWIIFSQEVLKWKWFVVCYPLNVGTLSNLTPHFLSLILCQQKKYRYNHLKNKRNHIKKQTIFRSSARTIHNTLFWLWVKKIVRERLLIKRTAIDKQKMSWEWK